MYEVLVIDQVLVLVHWNLEVVEFVVSRFFLPLLDLMLFSLQFNDVPHRCGSEVLNNRE